MEGEASAAWDAVATKITDTVSRDANKGVSDGRAGKPGPTTTLRAPLVRTYSALAREVDQLREEKDLVQAERDRIETERDRYKSENDVIAEQLAQLTAKR